MSVEVMMRVEAHISIEIDPEDMERVSEFFENIIFNQHQPFHPIIRSRCGIFRFVKKFLNTVFQMFGIMATLIGANLVTTKLSQTTFLNSNYTSSSISSSSSSSTEDELCENKFGCNQGLCWRSCIVDKYTGESYESWCFSKADKNGIFQHCKTHLDCSGCWECSNPCVRKVSYFFSRKCEF